MNQHKDVYVLKLINNDVIMAMLNTYEYDTDCGIGYYNLTSPILLDTNNNRFFDYFWEANTTTLELKIKDTLFAPQEPKYELIVKYLEILKNNIPPREDLH